MAGALVAIALFLATPARAVWAPAAVDLDRPRILYRAADLPLLQARVAREPYTTLLAELQRRIREADGVALDDHAINAERLKARAAKNAAFLYALDRTLIDGVVRPFPTAEDRAAVGRRAHALLAAMYTRSRLAVPPPLGGWDRDISTSEELQQYATAYDTLLGAGYDFGGEDVAIAGRLADLAAELYENYVAPESAQGFATLHQNNHRAKVGAALATAAVVLAEYEAAPGGDPRGVRDPAGWLAYGLDQLDLMMRYVLVAGDGAYAEGPFYYRYTSQNLLPFWRAWDRLVGGAAWSAGAVDVPSYWRHPLLARALRWAVDMTVPDGSLAPIDDGNPFRCFYFGIAPTTAAGAWRWAQCPAPFDTDGNISLAAEAIATFDDAVAPAPPDGSPTAFYVEGGSAVFRGDWSADAVLAIVQAEHDTASLFGRDRAGRGVAPQSHEHAEPGAFLLHAFGERLALDPGYFSFTERTLVSRPQHHNVILVDGEGPGDYLAASIAWLRDPAARPPADGHATLSDVLDSAALDAARVTARYGGGPAGSALIERQVLFAADRYLVVADRVRAPEARTYTWLLHGNGGGDSGGSFERTAAGGRWSRPRASLDLGIAVAGQEPAIDTAPGLHEGANRARVTHTVLRASARGEDVHALQLLYPARAGGEPPVLSRRGDAADPELVLDDVADDRRVVVGWRAGLEPARRALSLADHPVLHSDGALMLFDADAAGGWRLAAATAARELAVERGPRLTCADRGRLTVARLDADRVEVVADCADPLIVVAGLPFDPVAVDGACAFAVRAPGEVELVLGRERRAVLHRLPGNGRPAADPGEPRRVQPPQVVPLDGGGSCDADGEALVPRWELVSAPAGSAWSLADETTWAPRLFVDRPGPYRVRLTVTDEAGAASRPAEVLIVGGDPGADGMDTDLDGWFDDEDPDGDESANRAPQIRVPLADRTLTAPVTAVEVAAVFTDPDADPLTIRLASTRPDVVSVAEGSPPTLRVHRRGRARLLVSAADGRGGRALQTVTLVADPACPGDCDADGQVMVADLLRAVRIALAREEAATCPALDGNLDGTIDIADLLAAVRHALDGCP